MEVDTNLKIEANFREDTHHQDAIAAYEQGNQFNAMNRHLDAFQCFARAVELQPNIPSFRLNLALAALAVNKANEFYNETAYQQAKTAAVMAPELLGHWIVLGEVCLACNKFPEAIAAYEKALTIDPSHGFLHAMLGFSYGKFGRIEESIRCHEKAVELDPELGLAHFLLSALYYEKYFDPKKTAYHGERAFKAKKPAALAIESMWNAAHGFLIEGDYAKGWNYFEARLRPNFTNTGNVLPLDRYPGKPLWRGNKGIRLLVQTEMGLGDAIVMARYLPLIKPRYECDTIFECHAGMLDLMQHNFPNIQCVEYGKVDPASFDEQIPMMSLPLVFKTRQYSVPWDGAYLNSDTRKTEEWLNKIKLCRDKLNVGICWFSGRNSWSADNHFTSKRKSVDFEYIKPLIAMEGVNWISLQADRDQELPNPGIRDFGDTAAIIKLMDLVVTVDTAVANLCGAMGKPFLLMDRYDHCWRWSDIQTSWYPTAKVFRQGADRDWKPVIAKIQDEILRFTAKLAA